MVSQKSINKQLKEIDFNPNGWNKSEIAELSNILLPDEFIYECVNGIYEGGFALLVSTDIRVLLIDKKPMGFLNVEDLRFDMISELDYNHRIMGASIIVSAGSKTLNFRSYNKERLRKLIGHVQHCMAENKKKESSNAEGQHQHLEQINQQLQAYLVAQHKQQQKLQDHLIEMQNGQKKPDPVSVEEAEMSPQLKDYLYAHGLMEKYKQETGKDPVIEQPEVKALPAHAHAGSAMEGNQMDEIYADGLQEVFGKQVVQPQPVQPVLVASNATINDSSSSHGGVLSVFEVNPLKIAYSWLPQALRSRKFGLSLPNISAPFTMPMPNSSQVQAKR
jgi:hypothetical protein